MRVIEMHYKEKPVLNQAKKAEKLKHQFGSYSDLVDKHEEMVIGHVGWPDTGLIEDMQKDPESYYPGNTIQYVYPDLSDERAKAINSGALMTQNELQYLEQALVEDKSDGWVTYVGYSLTMDDCEVFAMFSGYFQGQGGMIFEFYDFFDSETDARKFVMSHKYYFSE